MEQVRTAVNQDRRCTINDLCAEVGIGYGSCQRILTEQLNMHRIAEKFVPTVLTQNQKDSSVAICQKLKEPVINDPTFLLNVITGDESIVYACLRPRDKTAVFTMEESWVSKTQKSTYAKKQIEDDADLFL